MQNLRPVNKPNTIHLHDKPAHTPTIFCVQKHSFAKIIFFFHTIRESKQHCQGSSVSPLTALITKSCLCLHSLVIALCCPLLKAALHELNCLQYVRGGHYYEVCTHTLVNHYHHHRHYHHCNIDSHFTLQQKM